MQSDLKFAKLFAKALLSLVLPFSYAHAQDTVCARVKLEIKQDLTLERQGFDAEMKINNTTDTGAIENVSVVVKVTDENGAPVTITENPNDLSAKFFIRLSGKENIANVDGSGVVSPKTSAFVNWLLIPAPGSAGLSALGKKYLVGATLRYRFGGEDTVLELEPDVITVKPLPLLTLDYFLTKDVVADDPLTPLVEPAEPFTLGVRVKNNGQAVARKLKIDSAQPKIVENNQGLLINFVLTGSYLNDVPAQNSLLIDFGDIAGNSSKMGRWNMETTLAGKFTEFAARFTHADELGGALTSILQATNAHTLLRDVRVDLPGRDQVRDFLAQDGDVIRVYESEGADTIVTDRSSVATLVAAGAGYTLNFPATAGFAYVRLPDPFNGTSAISTITRSDAKQLAPENAWLSKTRNEQTKKWEYWVNFFDVNTTGSYDSRFAAPPAGANPPVLQFIADKTVEAGKQVSFVVEASSPDGKAVTISAAPLQSGATFTAQAANPQAPGLARAVFDWTPAAGTTGAFPIVFTAADNSRSVQRTATITVTAPVLPAGPGTPTIYGPMSGSTSLDPMMTFMSAQTSLAAQDSATHVQFELYADEGLTTLLASGQSPKGTLGIPSSDTVVNWAPPAGLAPASRYWWRARAFDGTLYSPWAYARFATDHSSELPDAFNQTSPAPDTKVSTLTPVLSWTNSKSKFELPINYEVTVYSNAAMTTVVARAPQVPEEAGGTTSWTVTPALTNGVKYYWRVVATRSGGPQTASPLVGAQLSATPRAFTVDTANRRPSTPVPSAPAAASVVTSVTPTLTVTASVDPESDPLTYVFEIDRVSTFDSAGKRVSAKLSASGGSVSWTVPQALVENTRYWWRVKAQDAGGDSAWTNASFLMSANNDAPGTPVLKNPGNGAWTPELQPSLDVMPVRDPEGDAVRYAFEVYSDAALTQKVTEGSSTNPSIIMPVPLTANAWYWWRARALDGANAAGPWSAPWSMYVGVGPVQAPRIAVTLPSVPTVPSAVTTGGSGELRISWEGLDANRQSTVSLFYRPTGSSARVPIVENLPQPVGAQSGTYVWKLPTTNALAAGRYYIFADVFDSRGVSSAMSPGKLVVPNAVQTGTLTVGKPFSVVEGLSSSPYNQWSGGDSKPKLWQAFGHGYLEQPNQWWSFESSMMVQYFPVPYQCSTKGPALVHRVGPVITEDLNFAGRVASASSASAITYASSNTGDSTLRVCDVKVLSVRKVDDNQSDFTVMARLSNLGTSFLSATATPRGTSSDITATGVLTYGPISAGETGTPGSTVVVRAPTNSGELSIMLKGLLWTVQTTR